MENHDSNDVQRQQLAELWSLGIQSTRMNDLNDELELTELAENIKQAMFQDYKLAYSEKGDMHTTEAESMVRI